MLAVELHDGAPIEVEMFGSGPVVMLLVDPRAITGERADELRRWGVDPRLGLTLCEGLQDRFRVLAVPYEAYALAHPRAETLTPDTIAADLLAISDAAEVDRFACYGYSWLAVAALQLALRTDRLTALAMGGYPPLGGPYAEMLATTTATHELAVAAATGQRAEPATPSRSDSEFDWDSVEVTLTPEQTRQFVTLYEALAGFDDMAALARVSCPRLCFVGTADRIEYSPRWVTRLWTSPARRARGGTARGRLDHAPARRPGPHPGDAAGSGPSGTAALAQVGTAGRRRSQPVAVPAGADFGLTGYAGSNEGSTACALRTYSG